MSLLELNRFYLHKSAGSISFLSPHPCLSSGNVHMVCYAKKFICGLIVGFNCSLPCAMEWVSVNLSKRENSGQEAVSLLIDTGWVKCILKSFPVPSVAAKENEKFSFLTWWSPEHLLGVQVSSWEELR